MSSAKLTLGVLVFLFLQVNSPLASQRDCTEFSNFDFPTHWGQLSLQRSLEHYFSSLDKRDGWAAILFSEQEELSSTLSPKGIDIKDKEALAIIDHFASGKYRQTNERFRVVVEEQATQNIHWVVKDAAKIQSFLTPNDFNHFFISRPNKSESIDYCSENLIIKSWECWISFRAFSKTVLLKGATVLLHQHGKLTEHWEWVDFQEVLKGWGLVKN